jgi:hypothetical protein
MVLSRFWYVLLGLIVGALLFVLYLAQSMYNRQAEKQMKESLSSDTQVVSWYLKNDARERSAHLIKFALESSIAKSLSESSGSDGKVPERSRSAAKEGLTKVAATIPKDQSFDAVFAVDQHGRVIAHLGYEQATGMEDFELGGYPVVADALHGFVRDDTLVLDRVYRVVARPVELDLGSMPAGAIVGARIIDDRFARELSSRTGAAVAFFANGSRVATGAPEDFLKSDLDLIINDLKAAEQDPDFKDKGRSPMRQVGKTLGAVYARMPGEAWQLGAGYVVGRNVTPIDTPLAFFNVADDKDKKSGPNVIVIALATLAAMGLGLLFSFLEHTKPLQAFRDEAHKLAKGQVDQLQPSKFRGIYRTIASDVNDGVDVAVGKGGGTRRAADLSQVLGDLPAEPQMSAFSFPGDGAPAAPKAKPLPVPKSGPHHTPTGPRSNPPPQAPDNDGVVSSVADLSPAPRRVPSAPGRGAPPAPAPAAAAGQGQNAEWMQVFDVFAATKQKCGESLDGFTFDKFQNTLKKHRDAIIERHGVKRVKFSVYVKDGKAALKASPIKE